MADWAELQSRFEELREQILNLETRKKEIEFEKVDIDKELRSYYDKIKKLEQDMMVRYDKKRKSELFEEMRTLNAKLEKVHGRIDEVLSTHISRYSPVNIRKDAYGSK